MTGFPASEISFEQLTNVVAQSLTRAKQHAQFLSTWSAHSAALIRDSGKLVEIPPDRAELTDGPLQCLQLFPGYRCNCTKM